VVSPPEDVDSDAGGKEGEEARQFRTDASQSPLQRTVVIGTQYIEAVLRCLQFVLSQLRAFLLLLASRSLRSDDSEAVNQQPDAALNEIAVRLKLFQPLNHSLRPAGALVLHFEPKGS
jgi:hypothetical protein